MRLAAGSALVLLAMLAAGCAQAPNVAGPGSAGTISAGPASAGAPGAGTDPATPASSDSQPPVITMSALPTDDSSDSGGPASTATDPGNPTDPVRPSTPADLSGFAPCAVPYVRVSVRAAGVGSSHAGYLLTFAGTGQIACELSGYPAVTVLDAKGHSVRTAARTPSGYLGGVRSGAPKPVLIGPGQTASALLEGEVIDLGGKACPAEPGLLITPPNTRTPARVKARTVICGGVQIHPVVAGTSGSSH